jgi:sec-independent protein translocase protein TatA
LIIDTKWSTTAMFGIGNQELLMILAVFVLLFGAKKLPELARGIGSSMREFKQSLSEDQKS